jgi:uncharacterized protein
MAVAPAPTNGKVSFEDDFYVPGYKIIISGKELRYEHDIQTVTYTDSLNAIDSCDFTVNNWDPDKLSRGKEKAADSPFKYSDEDTFIPWQDMELWMGYYRAGTEDFKRMLVGEISTMSPNFPASGASTLTVRALNMFHRFRIKQATRVFLKQFESDIAKSLVEDIDKDLREKTSQLRLHMDDDEIKRNKEIETKTAPTPFLEMHNQFPIVFLLQRARDIGYDLTMTPDVQDEQGNPRLITFHYRPSSEVNSRTYTLEWGRSLVSFQPTLQTAHQVSEVTVRGWDPQGKTKFEATATRADMAKEGVVSPADVGVTESPLAQKLEIIVQHPVKSKDEAQKVAIETFKQLAQGLVEAKGKTVGLPDLRSGRKIEIKGVGKRFSGTYMVTSTTHTIGDGGYTTDFSARREQKLK